MNSGGLCLYFYTLLRMIGKNKKPSTINHHGALRKESNDALKIVCIRHFSGFKDDVQFSRVLISKKM